MNFEKNTPKDSGEDIKNSDNIENKEEEAKGPESLARFDSVDEFKIFLDESKKDIILFENQIKQRQQQQETNEKHASMGEKQTKEYNDKIDVDIQEFQGKMSALQEELDEYDNASAILRRIDIAQNQKITNEKNASMGEKQTKAINTKIDATIAELNQELEEMVVKGKKSEEAKEAETTDIGLSDEKKESTESTDAEVSHEKEKSPDEELMEKIEQAIEGGDMDKIKDVLIDVLEKENKGGTLSDYNSDDEMKNHLQETLEELKGKLKKEERSEAVGTTTKPEKSKDPKKMTPEEKAGVAVSKPEGKGKTKEMITGERKEFERKENEAHEKAMEDKEMLYTTKINLMEDDANKDTKEVKKELLRTVEYVNKEKVKENCATEIKELIKLSYSEEAQKKEGEGKTAYEDKIGKLAETMNLSPEEIQSIVTTQRANLEELTYQHSKQKESKKESKWKKIGKALGKIAIYGVGGIGLGILTGGLAAGITMGVARITETIFKGKKGRKAREEAIAESKRMLLEKTEGTAEISEEEKKEKDDLIEKFYDDVFIKLSIAKQNQINGKEKENSELGMEIQVFEDEEYKPNDEKSKEEMKKLYAKRRGLQKDQVRNYLEEQGVSGEELESRVKLSAQLIEMEDNQKIMELDFAKRKVGAVGKIFTKIDSFLSSPLLLGGSQGGGDQTKEKLITASVFAIAGALARACPIARNILMAYAGMKLGSAAADLMFGKGKDKILKQVSVESINLNSSMDDISRAKAQLIDPKFKENNPIEHAKLQEKIFAIDRARMEKALGSLKDKGEDGGYIGETSRKLEETIKQKRIAKGAHKGMKIFLGVSGAVAGYFIGDYLSKQSEMKAEQRQRQQELAEQRQRLDQQVEQAQGEDAQRIAGERADETERLNVLAAAEEKAKLELAEKQRELAELQAAELNKEIIVQKGDTSWSLAEDQCEKRIDGWEDLSRSQKDYMIDWYKDKMVANPDAIGIEGGDASSLKIGDELDIAKIFSDPDEMTRAMGKAQGLSPEAIKNIMANREIIGNVMSQKLENVSGDNLIKAMNIMGGTEQSGAGFVQEFQNRATEMIGANASPEQVQTILHNPSLFGEIMRPDGNLTEVHNNVLHKCFELINGNQDMTIGEFQKAVIDQDSPLSRELWARLKDLNSGLEAQFGDGVGINQIGSIGGIANTSVGQEFGETMKGIAQHINEYGDKLAKLSEKTGFFDKLFGAEGKMEKVSALYKGAVEDFQANVASQQEFINESADLAKTYTDLTGGEFFQHAVLNYAKDQAKDIKNIAGKIVEFNKILTPDLGNVAN